MHFCTFVLIGKNDDPEMAVDRALQPFGPDGSDPRWDWYEIGGRWNRHIPGSRGNVISVRALRKSPHLRTCLPYHLLTPRVRWLERPSPVAFGKPANAAERRAETRWLATVRRTLDEFIDHRVVCVDIHSERPRRGAGAHGRLPSRFLVLPFPPFHMGQYFKAVNLKKREYVCPWCLGGVAKLWEWSANPWGAIFPLLLRKSTEGGGGDFHGSTYETDKGAIAGRWAGDPVVLVGDYDKSRLWDKLGHYRNISREVVRAWNPFIKIDERKLKFNATCSCNKH